MSASEEKMNENDMTKSEVVIISNQFSIVVKSLEKGLVDLGYRVSLFEDNTDLIADTMDRNETYIVYLQDSMLGDMKRIQKLYLVSDMIRDQKKNLIFIGSENIRELFIKTFPSIRDILWFNRPVDMKLLALELEKETERIRNNGKKKRVLIIDDDPLYAALVSDWLRGTYLVEAVTDGMQAIKWLANNATDLILLDYEMPMVDGPQVLEMLRSERDTASIPVIFLTGNSKKESIERVLSLKPQGYLLKTATRQKLLDTIGAFFAKQQ